MKMDDIDKRMLRRLQQNARATLTELGEEVMLSLPAISERLKKLEASGVIRQYTAILDPVKFNKQLTAIVFLCLDNPSHCDAFADYVAGEREIQECFYITGEFDYSLKVVTETTATLEKLLTRIKSVPGVIKTQTIVVLSTIVNRASIVVE